jgi:thiol-disulfide isomerase/thioredoxin
LALGHVGVARAEDGPAPRPWPAGRPTPALQLPGQDGGTLSLAELRGQPVLLNFWASWCEPFRAEMPSLELLETRHAADGLRVLAINFRETDAAVRRFIDSAGLTLCILRDRDGAAAQAFGVRVFPSTVGIGRDGRARFVVVGEVDWTGAQARRWIAPLLQPAR